jgi:hypothetical protein
MQAMHFCDRFNALFPVGVSVRYRIFDGQRWQWRRSRTVSRARLRDGEPSVWVAGAPGKYWPLECVRPEVGKC